MIYLIRNQYDSALPLLTRMIRLRPDNANTYYNIACIYARQNKTDEAVDWLKNAISRGFKKWDLIKTDKDLESIRDSSFFKDIMKDR